MAECICCGFRMSSGRHVTRVDDMICDRCKENGEVHFEKTNVAGCEKCHKVEVYYGEGNYYTSYLCRSCLGIFTFREQVDDDKANAEMIYPTVQRELHAKEYAERFVQAYLVRGSTEFDREDNNG